MVVFFYVSMKLSNQQSKFIRLKIFNMDALKQFLTKTHFNSRSCRFTAESLEQEKKD